MTTPGKGKQTRHAKKQTLKEAGQHSTKHIAAPDFLSYWAPVCLLIVSVLIVVQARIRLLAIPLERDEAGFAYIGHWMLRGKELYVDLVDNKLPGLYMIYGFFTSIFGYHATGVHLGLLLSNCVSAICFFFLLREIYNRSVAFIGTAFLILLLSSPNMLGFAAHATQLLLPFVLGGWLLFWKGIRRESKIFFLMAGLLLGTAFVIKQQSVVFGILAAVIWWPIRLWWAKASNSKLPWMEYLLLGIGGLLPVVMIVSYFMMTSRFDQLYFWSVEQPATMASTFKATRMEMLEKIFPTIIGHFEIMWLAGGAGLILLFMSGFKKGTAWFGVLLALFGLGSVIVGLAFYQHYFALVVPGVALLAAISLHWVSEKAGKFGNMISIAVAFLMIAWPLAGHGKYYFNPDYNIIHQRYYNQNMFPEIEKIGEELSRRVKEGDRIAVLGSEPGVLVAADREGCSKHLFMYPLLSDPVNSPALQEEYKDEIKECFPEYIVWNTVSGSWAIGYNQIQMFKQLMTWMEKHYATIGIAEFREDAPGVLVWDDALPTHVSQSQYKVYVFKKK